MAEVSAEHYPTRVKKVVIELAPSEARAVANRLCATDSTGAVNITAREVGEQIRGTLGSVPESETVAVEAEPLRGHETVKQITDRVFTKLTARFDVPRAVLAGVATSEYRQHIEDGVRDAYWNGYQSHQRSLNERVPVGSHQWEIETADVLDARNRPVDDAGIYDLRITGQHLRFLHVAIRRGLSSIVGPRVDATLSSARRSDR